MQREAGATALEFGDLGKERGDADAAGDQQVMARLGMQGEQVGRWRQLQAVALLHLLVQEARAATGILLQAHGDAVLRRLSRIAEQRIGVAQAALRRRQVHQHVAAGGEAGQAALLGLEGEFAHQRGQLAHRRHPHIEQGVHARPSPCGWSGSRHTPM
ncbi:hypothetical protein D3C75_976490 [compost metagenome]